MPWLFKPLSPFSFSFISIMGVPIITSLTTESMFVVKQLRNTSLSGAKMNSV